MTDQFESGIIDSRVKKSLNSPEIAAIFCLDINHSEAQLDLHGLVQRFPDTEL
jgi:hypothetical protein